MLIQKLEQKLKIKKIYIIVSKKRVFFYLLFVADEVVVWILKLKSDIFDREKFDSSARGAGVGQARKGRLLLDDTKNKETLPKCLVKRSDYILFDA